MNGLTRRTEVSTVFASFGSEYFLSIEEMERIALGLASSGVNFIWVVRFPLGEGNAIEEALSEGFLKRVGERAMILEGWAPTAKDSKAFKYWRIHEPLRMELSYGRCQV